MGKRTALYEKHIENNARIVNFEGWEMPLHYGSQLQEHRHVRHRAGMFDVSHMTIIDLNGRHALAYLQRLLANDASKLNYPGKALYSCMLNEQAGVIDDLIVYFLAADSYRMVVNAATREKDLEWLQVHSQEYDVSLQERNDLAMIAVQGPQARKSMLDRLADQHREIAASLDHFVGAQLGELFIARTGYTGEDGFEIMLGNEKAPELWQTLLKIGVKPVGLGARDTLRLEAGLNLYGTDMDENITPLECGLGWSVAWQPADRNFIGREVLQEQRNAGIHYKRVGLVLDCKGVLRAHQKVIVGGGVEGEITSGSFSPTLEKGIALARVPVATGDTCQIEIRGTHKTARVVTPPFVRYGKACL